jgi:beta-N-acetylhexosaminidase
VLDPVSDARLIPARERDSAPPSGAAGLGRLMLAFRGTTVPAWLRQRLAAAPAAGFTLFRHLNVRTPGQVRRLSADLQAAAATRPGAASDRPLLIAADQEGGQLIALGGARGRPHGWTPFAGLMAIGATGDAELAEHVGRAIGLELRAVGVNVCYGPVLDVVAGATNPALGIRSFGDDPGEVSRLGSAWLRGLQSVGVAATLKHFPGKGGADVDTHHALAVVNRDRDALEAVELRPFREGISAGARMVMSGHFALPAVTGSAVLPATLSAAVMTDLLRTDLGFDGVSITDALDMRALPQDATQAVDVLAAVAAGVDLLLATSRRGSQRRIESALRRAEAVVLFDQAVLAASERRIAALHAWLARFPDPPLDVVGSPGHRALARELAAGALTMVRDDGTLPLRLAPDARVLAVMPAPADLTPADTSSYVLPSLAVALRMHHPNVDEVVTAHQPTPAEIAGLRDRAPAFDAIVVGTISAAPGSAQADLVEALRAAGRPLVTVALRTPWDLLAYPSVTTHVCSYSILPDSMAALAAALFRGPAAFPGRLPVAVPLAVSPSPRAAGAFATPVP